MTGHQYTISVSDLPKDVVTGGSKAYPDLELTGADKIEQEGKISYILKYKNGNSPLRVQLTEKGTVIKLFDAQ
jgi:hypothetical protein